MNKFKMELTWHNCKTCPPEETYNDTLYVTNGQWVRRVEYSIEEGWYDYRVGDYLPFDYLCEYWWADMEQTVRGIKEFKECKNV